MRMLVTLCPTANVEVVELGPQGAAHLTGHGDHGVDGHRGIASLSARRRSTTPTASDRIIALRACTGVTRRG